jgi:sulfite reductase (ferredoxin)
MFTLPNKIIEDIDNYKKYLDEYLKKDMDFTRFIGIRIPWGIYSHRGKQVYMVRLRIPGGKLDASQIKSIAIASEKYGNGICHITTRQDIQIHGVKIENTYVLLEYLKNFNLSPRGGGGNTIRNITACHLSGVCKDEIINVGNIAESLSEYFLPQDDSYNLPRKFKIAFSGCLKDCVGCLLNDIGFLPYQYNEEYGFKVFVGGGIGAKPAAGILLENFIPIQEIIYYISAIKNVYYKNGDRRNKHHNRLKFLIQEIGFEKFKELYQQELKILKEQQYLVMKKKYDNPKDENTGEIPQIDDEQYKEFLRYNVQPQKQNGYSIIKLRIPQGDIFSENLLKIAELEKDFHGIEFRTSLNQNLCIIWVKNQDVYNLYSKINVVLNDFLYPDTLLDTTVCKGALTCNLGICNSPGLSKAIEAILKKEFVGKQIFKTLHIHINGCHNSCGHASVGQIGFYGLARRVSNRFLPFYKILLGGKQFGENTEFAEEIEIIPAKNVPLFLQRFLQIIENEIKETDNTGEFLKTTGVNIAKKIIEDFSYVPPYSENKDFYIDWGKTDEFSLSELGPGECGAGILNIIESDIAHSKIFLAEAEKESYATEKIKKSIFFSARALLIVKGKDPIDGQETLKNFYDLFIRTGITSQKFSDIQNVFYEISDVLTEEQKKEKFLYAKNFLQNIEELYQSMNSSLLFPNEYKLEQVLPDNKHFLDLKGTPCPINYVKAKIFLENVPQEEIVEILLDEGEPIENVPKSLESDGHNILNIEKEDGFYRILVKKGKGE